MSGVTPREALVILARPDDTTARLALSRIARILGSHGTQVVVVDASSTSPDKLQAITGVASVLIGPGRSPGLPDLAAGEQIFVDAWLSRQSGEPKSRSGEGLAWDSPGHEPP